MLEQDVVPTALAPALAPAQRRAEVTVALVLGLALAVRMLWAAIIPIVPVSDAAAYDTFARNLAAGGAFGWKMNEPSAYWPVGAPFVYSLVYRIFPPDRVGYGPVAAFNLLVGLAVVGLGMALARRWFGARAAILTGVLLALWPMHIEFTTVIASEGIFTALCLGGLLVWPERGETSSRRLVWAGLFFAAATYMRPTALLIPAALVICGVLTDRDALGAVRRMAVVYVVVLGALLPWAHRNYQQFGRFILVSTNGGPNLWMGNNPATDGGYQDLPATPAGMTEVSFHQRLGDEAVRYIREKPGAFAARSAVKAVRLYERETIGVAWNQAALREVLPAPAIATVKAGGQAFYLAVLVAAVGGVWVLGKSLGFRRALVHPAIVFIAYFTAIHAVVVIQDRYHFPVTPMMAALAAIMILAIFDRIRRSDPATVTEP